MLKMTSRPPMGWNSWNGYMGSPCEADLKATMRYMAAHLLPFGYEYCVTDAGWYASSSGPDTPTAEYPIPHYCCDRFGRPLPHPGRYPSVSGSFLPISQYAHSLGLKFGLHMMRGMNKKLLGHGFTVYGTDTPLEELIDTGSPCAWAPDSFGVRVDHPAAQAWYDALFANFAAWEIDFVKYDDIASPIHRAEIEMIHRAIDRCGRDILLSLSPGDTTRLEDAAFYSRHANMWRISKDFWDDWDGNLRESFDLLEAWNAHINAPGWPDADMIPIGWLCENPSVRGMCPRLTRFTLHEQQSLFTLFCIARSPLMLTCNLLRNTPELLTIQTQPDCIALNQRGEDNRPLLCGKDRGQHLWYARAGGCGYLACFQLEKTETLCEYPVPEDLRGRYAVDVWTGEPAGPLSETVRLPMTAHGCRLLRVPGRGC